MLKGQKDTEALRALFRELVADHATEIWRFAHRLCGDRAEADDLTQETYLEAWRALPSLASPAAGRAWLLRILTRRASRLWARRRRTPQTAIDPDALPDEVVALTPSRLELLGEERNLQRALAGLTPERRIAFLLVFQHGLSCREAADVLDIPRGTVLSRIHRARQGLRASLRGVAAHGEHQPTEVAR